MNFITQITKSVIFFFVFCLPGQDNYAQQINIGRIEQMPNKPSPYKMRNWKQVALGYDSLIFNFNLSGQYLPLIWWNTNTINYPEQNSFGLHTVVGTPYPNSTEAINVLPAVISASLVDIDKSNQNDNNWVLMCKEFFNNRPEENVYLNAPIYNSGQDWWYETMPNIFFYQLYYLYPNTGYFSYQFSSVADRWLEAIKKMGGKSTPWFQPNMNYRAWSLSTMKALTTGVPEPEAAGAIAWLMYCAYSETGLQKYRLGVEWALEFLTNLTVNPSYELQLPYGVYTAARMNAEIGTLYNIEKMINWCFDVGPLRRWGVILGKWGVYDVHGLIGEVNGSNDYAFAMNTFEHIGALVPLVRYDDRFSRAIGKWVLNAANAARLFYTKYLPDQNQDSEEWAHLYDPHSFLAHEAIRERKYDYSPYATGDAMDGGWGATNLALYGSSHVGILGGIIDTTNINMILQSDVLKTDYFHGEAYPTYLYYNPYDIAKDIQIDVGSGQIDLYDAVTNSFLKTNISGNTSFTIPADAAILLVLAPAGGDVTYNFDKTLINNVVVDYRSGRAVPNYPPRIKSLATERTSLSIGDSVKIYCTAEDRNNNVLDYTWFVNQDTLSAKDSELVWTAPDSEKTYNIICLVSDGQGGLTKDSLSINVVHSINHNPIISKIVADPRKIYVGTISKLTCMASDSDNDTLFYTWETKYGTLSDSGSTVTWKAPENQGYYFITCFVNDDRGAQTADSIGIIVLDSLNVKTGVPIAYYPFNGNANDESGFGNDGIIQGAILTTDRFGNMNSAYYFDGVNNNIRVSNNLLLNFQEAISISFWMKIKTFFDREAYPISHGNWENRWKVSIIPEKKVRWTVKTQTGIKDLDSKIQLCKDVYYNVTVLYDGSNFDIFIDGVLDNHSTFSGLILTTSIDLTIGQVLPGNSAYNFNGVLDNVRIYNYALSLAEIQNIYSEKTSILTPLTESMPDKFDLYQNYPNPFHSHTTVQYQILAKGRVTIGIFDLLGHKVRTLVNTEKPPGFYTTFWDGKDDRGYFVASGMYFYGMEIGTFSEKHKLVFLK